MPALSPQRRRQAAYLAAIILILAVRLIRLDSYPLITADEGGWPLSVRNWVETGARSSDYYMAPGYHWLLGVPFRLFGALHSVGRPASVLISLVTLFLFYRLVRRLAGEHTAFWAALLLGTSYPAVLIDRRALMEPFQLALMTGLCLAVAGRGAIPLAPARWLAAAALAAALLLTKASAVYLLPALVVSTLWPWLPGRDAWKRRLSVTAALAVGSLAAAAVFWLLYAGNPAAFLHGWSRDFSVSNVAGAVEHPTSGRFALNPLSIERFMRWFSEHEPLLFGLSVLGLLKALWDRQHTLMAAWYVLGGGFLVMQLYVQENHRVVLMPPMCFFAAYLLSELHAMLRQLATPDTGPSGPSWAQAALAVLVLYSAARLGGGMAKVSTPDADVLAWVAERTTTESRVMAAPYMLMRLRSKPVPFWSLGIPFVPTAGTLRPTKAEWLIVDAAEWKPHQAEHSGSGEALARALAQCCEQVHVTPAATVYRVKPAAPDRAASIASPPPPHRPPASKDR